MALPRARELSSQYDVALQEHARETQNRAAFKNMPDDLTRRIISNFDRRETIAQVKGVNKGFAQASIALSESENRLCGERGLLSARAEACTRAPEDRHVALPDGTRCCRMLCTPMLELEVRLYRRSPYLAYYNTDREFSGSDEHGGECFIPGDGASLSDRQGFMKLFSTKLLHAMLRVDKYVFYRENTTGTLRFRFEGGLECIKYFCSGTFFMVILYRNRPLAMLYDAGHKNLVYPNISQLVRMLARVQISCADAYAIELDVLGRETDRELSNALASWFKIRHYAPRFCIFTESAGRLPRILLYRPSLAPKREKNQVLRHVTDAFFRAYRIFRKEMVEKARKGLLRGQALDGRGEPLSPIRLLTMGEAMYPAYLEGSSSDEDV